MLFWWTTLKTKESETINKYLDLARELKDLWECEGDGETNCNRFAWNGPQGLEKKTREIENQRMNRDHSHHSIVEIIWNT